MVLAADRLAAVDMQRLARDEGRSLEVEDRLDDIGDLADSSPRVERLGPVYDSGSWAGVLMTPSETALTRTPREAYSIARDRLAATSPPFVRAGSADGLVLSAWSTRLVETFTTCPLPRSTISAIASCVMWKNPVRFTAMIAA